MDQVAGEVGGALELIDRAYRSLGITAHRYRLSLPGESGKYVAEPELWRRSTAMLREVLGSLDLTYDEVAGEAAFYGPKIDVQIADGAGRESTLSTAQIDFHQPERFDLHYIGADGAKHRPVMVHRSIIGSVERAVAHLVEQHAGAFPPWLSPTQLVVLPVSDEQSAIAFDFVERCVTAGLRADLVGPERGGLGSRIRDVRLVPYQCVVGPQEASDGTVAVRLRDGRRPSPMSVPDLIAHVQALTTNHSTSLWR